jgi:uncharacterized OsmC-like protein
METLTNQQQGDGAAAQASPGQVLRARQGRRVQLYKQKPEEAWTIDHAETHAMAEPPTDPMHTRVAASAFAVDIPISVHRNIGGLHDGATPGDVLCAALAACADSTFRIVASQLGIRVDQLAVRVEGEVDVRGTLCMTPEVPVGFQKMHLAIEARCQEGTDERLAAKLQQAVEHCCIVLQTLRSGVPVDIRFDVA